MVHLADQLKFQPLESELEALLVEAELIRTHQPPFNILLKDDKSPIYVHITDEKFPRVLTLRKREIVTQHPSGTILGPFPSAYKLREVLKLIRPIFPWCSKDNSKVTTVQNKRACFFYHLDLCPGACTGEITSEDYQRQIKQLSLFLRGKKTEVVQTIKTQLNQAVEKEEFEQAAIFRDRLQLISDVTNKQVRLAPDIELPQLQQSQKAEQIVQLQRILSEYLSLPKRYPLMRIEGYDVSNISGTNPTVAMVTAIDGNMEPAEYKLFNIRTLNTPNDYGMLKEALTRRQNHPEWGQPSLLVIDGGKGQLKSAFSVWQDATPIISIAKNPDRLIIPIIQVVDQQKKIVGYHELKLPSHNPALKLVQQLRDEAHRFSKKQHTRMRQRQMLSK